jgi:histidine triad (HIT) family protein
MKSIFSKIIAREIPAHFIYEDDRCVAILDKFPAIAGQTLVIPKQEIDYIFNLDDATYLHLLTITKLLTTALDTAYETERTCMVVEGFEVPHVHIKLYPMTNHDVPLGQLLPGGTMAEDSVLEKEAEKIIAALTS